MRLEGEAIVERGLGECVTRTTSTPSRLEDFQENHLAKIRIVLDNEDARLLAGEKLTGRMTSTSPKQWHRRSDAGTSGQPFDLAPWPVIIVDSPGACAEQHHWRVCLRVFAAQHGGQYLPTPLIPSISNGVRIQSPGNSIVGHRNRLINPCRRL